MADLNMGQGPNYFGALAELAKDVGAAVAQINERVTYKELMTQNTEQRREISSKIDKVEERVLDTVRSSVIGLESRIDALTTRVTVTGDTSQQTMARLEALSSKLETLTSTLSLQRGGFGGGKFAVGSIATLAGSAIGVGGYLLLRSFGVAP